MKTRASERPHRGRVVATAQLPRSERARVKQPLGAGAEMLRGVLAAADIGMALVPLDGPAAGTVVEVNAALAELTAMSAEELLGTEFGLLHQEAERHFPAGAMARLVSGEAKTVRYQVRWLSGSGRLTRVAISASLVQLSAAGNPRFCLCQVSDITNDKHLEERLSHLADHDDLTGLFNRRRFITELQAHVVRAVHHRHGCAVLVCDLDQFRYVNDALGHAAGDTVIVEAAQAVTEVARPIDTAARLEGDTFALVLPGLEPGGAERVASRLLAELRQRLRVGMDAASRPVTASIGIALLGVRSDPTDVNLINEAEIAMNDAKDAGGDRCVTYAPARVRHDRMNSDLDWVHTIRRALAREDLVLHAQRIRSLVDEPGERFELLLRLVGDEGSLIPPGAFLPIAERFGLAREIDFWVADQAISLLAEHSGTGRDISLAVNLSAHSIVDDELLRAVASRLRATGVDPKRLCFELTETVAISNVDTARGFAARLRDMGCEFALDDFGAGYGSFRYLKHLHFDYIKIDGEFVNCLAANHASRVIVSAVVKIAKDLGKKTVAEFVEDATTMRHLRAYGVDYAQGYFIGVPAPLTSIHGDLRRAA